MGNMTQPTLHRRSRWIEDAPPAAQWTVLITLSLAFGAFFYWLGVSAALLIGPLLAGIVVSGNGARLQIPRRAFVPVQGLIGCMIARMLPVSASAAGGLAVHWPLLAAGVISVIAASIVVGWILVRLRVLPGTTALWGVSPGAATVMTLMAEAHGADAQLVAVMQYLRVLLVAAIASVIAKVFGVNSHHALTAWFSAPAWLPLIATLVLALGGALIGTRLRIPMGAMIVPLVAGVLLAHRGWLTIELPHWLLAITYAFVGWRIGLRFTRPLLAHALRALPRILMCTFALIVACAGIGAMFVALAGVDPLTAYLATSPGGADSVAIIAASSNVDVRFVMSMQMVRFGVVLIVGPMASRFLARRIDTGHRD